MCYINYGEGYGTLVVIVDILDNNKVLIDGIDSNNQRCLYPLKRLTLLKFKLPILKGAKTGTV